MLGRLRYLLFIAADIAFICTSLSIGQSSKKPKNLNLPIRSRTGITIPGKSVGDLRLGDTQDRFWDLFPKKQNVDEEYHYSPDLPDCPSDYSELHWLPPKFDDNGIFTYLVRGRIVQIAVHTARFPTAKGIKPSATPLRVKAYYPGIDKTLVNLGSGSKVVGGRDLIYWVDSKLGIAFEFAYWSRQRGRLLRSIYIFKAGTDLIPEACVSEPQTLREIKLFSLEPPAQLVREWKTEPSEK